MIEFYPTGSSTVGSYNAGTGIYDYTLVNRALAISTLGVYIGGTTAAPITASYSGTATLAIASLAALTSVSVAIPVTGAVSTGVPAIPVSVSGSVPAGLVYQNSYVSASGTVTASYFNANPVSSVSGTFTIRSTTIQP